MHRRERALSIALAIATLAWAAHRALRPMDETDLFFHLKLGDLIRARHAIPFQNLFSFTYPDHPDPDLAWGFQVLVSLLHQWEGFAAIVVLESLLVTLAAALIHKGSVRAGAGPLAASIALVLALLAADQRIVARPHLVTFAGIGAITLLLIEAERRPRLLWLAPVLILIWANFHAGVFFGPLLIALTLLGGRFDRVRIVSFKEALFILLLSIVATVMTPAGLRLPRYLLWHTGLGATRVIEEFRRADAWDDPWFFVLLTLCLLALIARGRRAAWRRALPALAIAPLAFRSVRFVAEWALIAAPFIAIGLTPLERWLRERRSSIWLLAQTLAIGLFAFDIVASRVEAANPLGLAEDVVPFRAIEFVTRNGLRERLYSDLDVGCYLLWEGWPRYRVFQDARLPAYPDEFHRALDETPLEPAAWDALLRRYRVDSALIADPGVNMRAGSFDPEEWALVYREDDALVFARRTPRFAAVIARYEIPLRVRFRFDGGSRVEPIDEPPARAPFHDAAGRCEWDRRLARALFNEGDRAGARRATDDMRERRCPEPSVDGSGAR